MPWLKITLAVNKDQLDAVTERFELAGAQAVTIEDAGDHPLFDRQDGNTPVWEDSLATGLFDAAHGVDDVLSRLTETFEPEHLPDYRVESLPDQDWERCWMDRFQPIQYGPGLWVCPSWCEAPDPEATNILLDPGLAFGSGSHETTRLCLQWLSEYPVKGKRIIDFGCGSGILAVAALKLGASGALGVDIDPQALQASRRNAELNHVSEELELELPQSLAGNCSADIVFANILAGTLLDLKDDLLAMRASQGVLILSGILQSQENLIVDAYGPGNHIRVKRDGDWLMIAVKEEPESITGTME